MPDREHLDLLEMTPLELAELRRWGRERARPARYRGSARSFPEALEELRARGQSVEFAPTLAAPTRREKIEREREAGDDALLYAAGGAAIVAGGLWWWWRSYRAKPLPTGLTGYDLGLDVLGNYQ